MIIKDALDRYAARPTKMSETDRSQTIGASEIGQCSRRVWYLKVEVDPQTAIARDEEFSDEWGARQRGITFEDHFWVPAMRKRFGDRLLFAGRAQSTLADGYLSATPDGLVVDLTEDEQRAIGIIAADQAALLGSAACVMVECKTIDPRTNLFEAKDENVYQTQVQMGLMRLCSPYKPTHSVISYTDASWWNIVQEYVVPFDVDVFENARVRALKIMTANSAADLKPEGWIAGGRECKHCPFTRACGIERKNVPFTTESTKAMLERIGSQFVAEATDLALQVRLHERERDNAEVLMREAQETLKERMRSRNIRSIPGVVTWSPVKGRAGYDNAAIREAAVAAGVDVEQFATEGEPGERLTIRVASPSEDASSLPPKQQATSRRAG